MVSSGPAAAVVTCIKESIIYASRGVAHQQLQGGQPAHAEILCSMNNEYCPIVQHIAVSMTAHLTHHHDVQLQNGPRPAMLQQ